MWIRERLGVYVCLGLVFFPAHAGFVGIDYAGNQIVWRIPGPSSCFPVVSLEARRRPYEQHGC